MNFKSLLPWTINFFHLSCLKTKQEHAWDTKGQEWEPVMLALTRNKIIEFISLSPRTNLFSCRHVHSKPWGWNESVKFIPNEICGIHKDITLQSAQNWYSLMPLQMCERVANTISGWQLSVGKERNICFLVLPFRAKVWRRVTRLCVKQRLSTGGSHHEDSTINS